MTIFKVEDSKIILKYEECWGLSWMEITCNILDKEDIIEISECGTSVQRESQGEILKHPYLYKFIIRKNTKYEIANIDIHMNSYEANGYFHTIFTFKRLIITFPEYSRKCTLKRKPSDVAAGDIYTNTVYDDLTPYGGSCIDEVDPAIALKLAEMEKDKSEETDGNNSDATDGDISEQTDGDKSDQTDGDESDQKAEDITDQTDGDISDQTNEKKGFWTTRNILAIVLPIVAVIICVVIFAIILRYHKS
ncbi:hypothetical protein RF11_15279 [Thelohanellus kitauei]|uniref:Uncharacterized protein n=1 Tax=Thelohanellus kitauei TaxID=669202 RepID=A0A0C2JAR1_THEKT|nr:hypothetical protein RF11_15279 [Thelohanellus kitauei]